MNITFLVNYDLASALALNYLIPQLPGHNLSVFYSRKVSQKNPPRALTDLVEYETAVLAGLGNANNTLSLNRLERYTCQAISEMNSVNKADLPRLQQSEPALIVCIRHMTILQDQVIQAPKSGVINLHSGLLPAYQGVMASFRAMLNGDTLLGTSLHYIEDNGIDTGGLIDQAKVPCRRDKSYLWNVLNLYQTGCGLILETIKAIAANRPVNCSKQSGKSEYFSFPTETDLAAFKKAGYRLYDNQDCSDFMR